MKAEPLPALHHRSWSAWASGLFLLAAVLLALFADYLPLADPMAQSSDHRLQPPSAAHWLGTDDLGRDVLSRMIHGGRYSLSIGILAVGLAAVVGIPLGIVGGYFGGWTDRLFSSLVELLMAFPGVLLALVMVAVLGPSLTNVMIAVGIAQIPVYARQARASALSVRQQEYVLAGRACGSTEWFILTRHVLPNVAAPLLVVATMGLGSAILDAAGLSFLGLSGDPSRPEWGSMLTADRERVLRQPWLIIAPGAAITGSVLAFNILGDCLQDKLNPRGNQQH
ncbi:MAG: ABC transporter permease [Planctomycetota bacterium]